MGATGFQLNAFNHVHHQPSDACGSLGADCDGMKNNTKRSCLAFAVFPVCLVIYFMPLFKNKSPLPPLNSCFLDPGIRPPRLTPYPTLPLLPASHPQALLNPQVHLPALRVLGLARWLSAPQLCGIPRALLPSYALPRYAFSRFFFSVSM